MLAAAGGVGFYMHSSKEKAKVAAEEAKTADPDKTQERYEKLKEQATVKEDPNDPMNREIDFAALQEVNPDVYAWIWIPGTNVDYPILQSETEPDEYYLNHTIEREACKHNACDRCGHALYICLSRYPSIYCARQDRKSVV